jgi:CTP synthase (UTP-ammonia lyase)
MDILKPQNALLTSLVKALDEIDSEWRNYEGLIIPGSWPGQDDEKFIQEAIPKIKEAKEKGTPFLGLCLGLHALAISEGGKVVRMDEQRQGIYPVKGWWGETQESHWHRYKVEGEFKGYEVYKTEGIIEVVRKENVVATQFHPEYSSSKKSPHPILKEFIKKCIIATTLKASEN